MCIGRKTIYFERMNFVYSFIIIVVVGMCVLQILLTFFCFFSFVFSFVWYLLYSVFALLQALDADGDGRIQLDEFEGWVTKGFHMNLKQLETFAGEGESQAVLVDFLLSLRADVKGVMRRIVSKIQKRMG
jgi:hypothetical protein